MWQSAAGKVTGGQIAPTPASWDGLWVQRSSGSGLGVLQGGCSYHFAMASTNPRPWASGHVGIRIPQTPTEKEQCSDGGQQGHCCLAGLLAKNLTCTERSPHSSALGDLGSL